MRLADCAAMEQLAAPLWSRLGLASLMPGWERRLPAWLVLVGLSASSPGARLVFEVSHPT